MGQPRQGLTRFNLKGYAPGEEVARSAHANACDLEDWIGVPVPGDVHQALMATGRIAAADLGTPVSGALFYDQILPLAVAELDGCMPYWR